MKAYQLIQAISSDLRLEILNHLDKVHRPAYRLAVSKLAAARKLRPEFIQKKPKTEQHAWLYEQLKFKTGEDLAAQIIQLWLLKGQQGMLTTFLDAVGIAHKDGEVEELPEEISKATAAKGIAALLDSVSAEKAALYLHMFQMQRDGGWAGITEAMAAEPKLRLPA